MHTEFILHGGVTSVDSLDNDTFFSEFTKADSENTTIILCPWAWDKKDYEKALEKNRTNIKKHAKNNFSLKLANTHKELEEKIGDADIVYFPGGTTEELMKEAVKISHPKKLFGGKKLIGSSAGAFLLGTYYISSFHWQNQEVNKGLGLLPIQVLCHFDVDKDKEEKLEHLRKKSNLPILMIDECKRVKMQIEL